MVDNVDKSKFKAKWKNIPKETIEDRTLRLNESQESLVMDRIHK